MSRFLTVILASTLALAPLSAVAQEEMVEAKVQVISYDQLSPSSRSIISDAARVAFVSIADARKHLAEGNRSRSRSEIAKALKLMSLIQKASPSADLSNGVHQVRDAIVSGSGAKPEDLVPLYSKLDVYSQVTVDVVDVREKLDRAKTHLAKDETVEAIAVLEEASTSIRYAEIDLPVAATIRRLEQAQRELGMKQLGQAQGALDNALNSAKEFAGVIQISVAEEFDEVELAPVGAGSR